MNGVVFTESKSEYEWLARLMREIIFDISLRHEINDEHFRMTENSGCDIAVIAIDGALGMEIVQEHRYRYPNAKVIWITDDKYFAGVAIRQHIFDFIVRPVPEIRFREAIQRVADEYNINNSTIRK